jgi:hypothetical protein
METENLWLILEAQCIPEDQQERVNAGLTRGASIADARLAVALIRAAVGNFIGDA